MARNPTPDYGMPHAPMAASRRRFDLAHPPAFDRNFAARSPLFWPIAGAAERVFRRSEEQPRGVSPQAASVEAEFPPVEWFNRVFDAEPAVRFVLAAPRPRRRGRRKEAIDPSALYDARITVDRLVPSRADSWHDLMNALVWGTFPRAKAALHARQHRAIEARIEPGARTLPPSRTRELDALALLDEGGVVVPAGDPSSPIVFGHAIYESLALGIRPAVVAAIELAVPGKGNDKDRDKDKDKDKDMGTGMGDGVAAVLAAVDEALALVIADDARLESPEALRRIDLASHV
jgi:Protein of unknown function (DUF3025)